MSSFFDVVANDEVTLHGLEKWTIHLYEHLGWMTLAYSNGMEEKVNSYLISIKKLKLSIESRLKIITNEDSKIDLTTLLTKTKHLYRIATKLFDENHLKKTICDKCALVIKPDDSDSTEPNEHINTHTNKHKLDGGSKTKKTSKTNKSSKTIVSKSAKTSKSTIQDNKKTSKKSSKKDSKKPLKKLSKKDSKKISKKIQNEPLIKKLSKKSSKKNSKIFKKI